jgi:LemA protein
MEPLLLGLVLCLLPLLFVVLTYNLLVRVRAHVKEAWSNVDVELRRRHDLIPNLVETTRAYASHEQGLLAELARLRERAHDLLEGQDRRALAGVEGELSRALSGLMLRVEAYPELKAAEAFQALAGELAHTEDRIAQAQRLYNGNVRELNIRCQTVPSNLVAGWFGFKTADYFELPAGQAQAPAVKL